jgi:acyl homoserine lactone synthase
VIVTVEQHNAHKYPTLLDDMFRLRARIFQDRLRWDVTVTDGKERDRYDDEAPVYIIYADDNTARIKGSLRLLPTTGPTLLADTFADTLPDAALMSAPTIWECTRFCLDDKMLDRGNRDELQIASGILIAALGEIGLQAGIESILGNFDAGMLRLYRRIGCEVETLGCTRRFGRPVYLGLFPITEAVLANVKSRLKTALPRQASHGRFVDNLDLVPA